MCLGVVSGYGPCANSPNYGVKFWTAGYRIDGSSVPTSRQFAWKIHSVRAGGNTWIINPMNYTSWAPNQPSNYGGKSVLSHTPGSKNTGHPSLQKLK